MLHELLSYVYYWPINVIIKIIIQLELINKFDFIGLTSKYSYQLHPQAQSNSKSELTQPQPPGNQRPRFTGPAGLLDSQRPEINSLALKLENGTVEIISLFQVLIHKKTKGFRDCSRTHPKKRPSLIDLKIITCEFLGAL